MICTASGDSVAMPSRTAARGTREVNHEGAAGDSGQPTGHARVDDPCRQPRGAQRLGDAEKFTIEDVDGSPRV